jgi:hypothetical protein
MLVHGRMIVEYANEYWVVKHLYEECRGLFKSSIPIFTVWLRKPSERISKGSYE